MTYTITARHEKHREISRSGVVCRHGDHETEDHDTHWREDVERALLSTVRGLRVEEGGDRPIEKVHEGQIMQRKEVEGQARTKT